MSIKNKKKACTHAHTKGSVFILHIKNMQKFPKCQIQEALSRKVDDCSRAKCHVTISKYIIDITEFIHLHKNAKSKSFLKCLESWCLTWYVSTANPDLPQKVSVGAGLNSN